MTASIQDVSSMFFDYIIVGGGTAGLCLAARLSEDPSVTVLCLEAGEANLNDPAITRPGQFASHFGQKSYDWGFKTTPQKHANNTVYDWPRGKGLGGSSAINFLCWTKPPAENINDWERLGNPGWNWTNYEKFVSKVEKVVYDTPEAEAQKPSNPEAPLLIARPATLLDIDVKIQETLMNMGIPVAPNPLGGDPTGAYFAPSTIDPKTQTRSYSVTAFFNPNVHRPNFSVLVSANVNKIITSELSPGHDLIATGVEFMHKDETYIVHAKKEVILCAGALKSPQILELSGIGRKDVLETAGIQVKLDLPGVGENVQEHVFAGVTFELPEEIEGETYDLLRDPEIAKRHIDLHADGKGLFTMGITGYSFVPLKFLSDQADSIHKSLKDKISQNAASYSPGLLDQYKIQLEQFDRSPGCEIILFPGFLSFPNPPTPGKRYFTIMAAMNHMFSRGTIHVTSADPAANPAFDPNYFEEEADLHAFVETMKFVRKVPEHAPFKDIIGSPIKEVNPGPQVETDAQVAEHLKNHMCTTYHTAGSLSMLPRNKGGVVDPTLKVYGTANIRVIDLSVAPLHIAAHPQATVYAIAEQGAAIIQGK